MDLVVKSERLITHTCDFAAVMSRQGNTEEIGFHYNLGLSHKSLFVFEVWQHFNLRLYTR